MRILVTPAAGHAGYLKVHVADSRIVRQPFDGAVLERPGDYVPWQSCSDAITTAMVETVRKACPLAVVERVA